MKIAPSILSLDYSKFKEQLDILNNNVEYIHFDVMDGHFVPNISFGSIILDTFNKNSDLIMDVHLMISDPMKYTDDFIKAGADIITFHVEALNNDINKCKELIKYIHFKGIKAGISVKPNTDVKIIDSLLNILDLVLIMSVEPGFGGQKFIESSLDKVKYLKSVKESNNYNYIIEIDGGINDQTAIKAKEAGVELAVAGSYLFNGDIKNNINKLSKI